MDGAVDLPKIRALMKDKPDDFFVSPDAVADTAYQLTRQHPSAWSFEVEARLSKRPGNPSSGLPGGRCCRPRKQRHRQGPHVVV